MVKADNSHDYYGELELNPNASIDDIKRQFKKLALKYHPDRNPGKELEFTLKFQAIQAAHEILGDPLQKNKYDAERRKQGGFPRAPAPRYRDPTADVPFPPPPMRTKPRPATTRPTYTSTTSSGADRFSNFPQPTSSARTNTSQHAEARANTFKAWQNMHHKAPPPPPRSQFGRGRPPSEWEESFERTRTAPDASSRGAPSPPDRSERPRSAWQEMNNRSRPDLPRSASSRTTRRAGFDPTAPGSDEAQAPGPSAYTTSARPAPPPLRRDFPPPPPGPPPSAERPSSGMPDPLSQFRSHSGEDVPFAEGSPRVRSPWQSNRSERTYLSTEALRRSASTRDASKTELPKSNVTPQHATSNEGRHRSASPVSGRTFSNGTSSTGTTPEKTRTGVRSSAQRGTSGQGTPQKPFILDSDSDNDDDELDMSDLEETSPQGFRNTKPGPAHVRNGMSAGQRGPGRDGEQFNGAEQKTRSNIFTFPVNHSAFSPPGPEIRSRSTESINTKFSPREWNGKFTGNPDYFGGPTQPGLANIRRRASPTKGQSRPSPSMAGGQDIPFSEMPPPPPPPPPPHPPPSPLNSQPSVDQPSEVRFSAEEWQKTFKDPSWTYPIPGQDSPTRPVSVSSSTRPKPRPQSRKQSKSAAHTPKPAVVEEVDDDDGAQFAANGNTSPFSNDTDSSRDSNAMDIDPPPFDLDPAVELRKASVQSEPHPRLVAVQPGLGRLDPTWHGESGAAAQHQRAQTAHAAFGSSTAPSGAPLQRQAGSAGPSLADLKNVAPLAPSNSEGVQNLSDIATSLPFASRPSFRPPVFPSSAEFVAAMKEEKRSALVLPQPPKAPAPPAVGGAGASAVRMSKAVWAAHLSLVEGYMRQWDVFEATILAHFAERIRMRGGGQGQAGGGQEGDKAGSGGAGREFAWLGVFGDEGFERWRREWEEDERVRECWGVARERHLGAVEAWGRVRERVRRGGLVEGRAGLR